MHLGMHHDIYVYSGYIKYVLRFIIPRKMKLIFVYQQEIEKKNIKRKTTFTNLFPQKNQRKKIPSIFEPKTSPYVLKNLTLYH